MADNQHSQWPTLTFFKQQRPDIPLDRGIELRSYFIGNQKTRTRVERPQDGNSRQLTARKLSGTTR